MLKHENFVYWLQGFFEISGAKTLNEEQVKIIKEHIDLCFLHIEAPTSPQHVPSSPLPQWKFDPAAFKEGFTVTGSSTLPSIIGGPSPITTIC